MLAWQDGFGRLGMQENKGVIRGMNDKQDARETTQVFTYTYSAKRQEEIEAIRKKYVPQEEDTMEKLRRLDRRTDQKGTVAALCVGTFSTLLLGIGMCCTMVWADRLFAAGIVIGLIGMAGMAAAYPLYIKITKAERARIAPEILRLTDELMK